MIMTKEQITKGNFLLDEIRDFKRSEYSIKKSLKELELTDFKTSLSTVRIDREECCVSSERLIVFLSQELQKVQSEITQKEKDFDNL